MRDAHRAATGPLRQSLDDGLADALVYVRFDRKLALKERRGAIPEILQAIADLPATFIGDWSPRADSPLFGRIRSIGIRRGHFPGPQFDVEAVDSIGDPTVDRIRGKWDKTYTTPHPIELLAYYAMQPLGPEVFWLARLELFIEENWTTAPFRRVWVFDLAARNIAYSAARPG